MPALGCSHPPVSPIELFVSYIDAEWVKRRNFWMLAFGAEDF